MKVVNTCDGKPAEPIHISAVPYGTVFTYGSHSETFLRLYSKTLRFRDQSLWADDTMTSDGKLDNYKVYPNARVVLE